MAVIPDTLSLDAFLALPEEEPPLEFMDGDVTQRVSPRGKHRVLQAALIRHMDGAGLARNVARAIPELRCTFGGASVVPDVAVFRWERVPVDAEGDVADVFLEAPDGAIEIVSPGQSVTALVRRCLWYVANGVQMALLVDPEDRSVLAFCPDQPVSVWRDADCINVSGILPEFAVTVQELFSALRQA